MHPSRLLPPFLVLLACCYEPEPLITGSTTQEATTSFVFPDCADQQQVLPITASGTATRTLALGKDLMAAHSFQDGTSEHPYSRVHVYQRQAGAPWAETAMIVGDFASRLGQLDGSLAVAENLVVMGSANWGYCDTVSTECEEPANTGSGYASVYDTETRVETRLPVPPDYIQGDYFGYAVDVDVWVDYDGEIRRRIAVGAPRAGKLAGQGSGAGRVYIYDESPAFSANWTLTDTIPPTDNPFEGFFGAAVGLDQDSVTVGAPEVTYWKQGALQYDDIGSIASSDWRSYLDGAVYVYLEDIDTGLLTSFQSPITGFYSGQFTLEHFGHSIDTSRASFIAGSYEGYGDIFEADPDPTSDRYLLRSRLEGAGLNGAGLVAISGGIAVASTDTEAQAYYRSEGWWYPLGKALGKGAAIYDGTFATLQGGQLYVYELSDTDEDGLFDCWERDGFDYDGDGIVDLDLPGLGADPMHKDLFLEVDVLSNVSAGDVVAALELVRTAFLEAPVDNPDQIQGITLHAELSDIDLAPMAKGFTFAIDDDLIYPFENYRSLNFTQGNPAKRLLFRYALFGDRNSDKILGVADFGGDLMVFPPAIKAYYGQSLLGIHHWIASTIMHELGHALVLRHGGGDNVNHKPNYISIMNYSRHAAGGSMHDTPFLDYSRHKLATLHEGALLENVGIAMADGSVPEEYLGMLMPFWAWIDAAGVLDFAVVGDPVDWDGNLFIESTLVTEGAINRNLEVQTLRGHNDWENLTLTPLQLSAGKVLNAIPTKFDMDLTTTLLSELTGITPTPWCGNGVQDSETTIPEDCDAYDNGGQTCASLGFESGFLHCNIDCTFYTAGCQGTSGPVCGNGVREEYEACDGGDLAGWTCDTYWQFNSGTLGCDQSCEFDTSDCTLICTADGSGLGCTDTTDCCSGVGNCTGGKPSRRVCAAAPAPNPICGDGVMESGEECDGADLGGSACTDRGYTGGTLSCNADCTSDESQCTGAVVCTAGGVGVCTSSTNCCSGVGNCTGGKPSKRVCK